MVKDTVKGKNTFEYILIKCKRQQCNKVVCKVFFLLSPVEVRERVHVSCLDLFVRL